MRTVRHVSETFIYVNYSFSKYSLQYLLCTRCCSRHWGKGSERGTCPQGALVGSDGQQMKEQVNRAASAPEGCEEGKSEGTQQSAAAQGG